MRVFLPLFAATFTLLIHPYVCMEIIGGKEAIPHSRPYMAYINTQGYTCGGTLIDSRWVLTAAHCRINSATTIKLGLHSLSKEDQYVQRLQVSKWRPHPRYNKLTFDNDVQLVQFSGKATLNCAVKPLNLPTTFSDVEPGTICESAGWGRTRNAPNSGSDKLLEVSLPAISREACADMWGSHEITKNMMCTLDAIGGKTTCNGDSGGPLICQDELRGVVSFGPKNNCGHTEFPPGYAFLNENIVNWIKGTIKNVNWIKGTIKNVNWIKREIKKK
ncbi:granzyme A-like isoform X1 [Hyperolius riggenbachi]|uniref:granzyme A-like isoform X1 n=2 Tax=Hyperolius riggenbachi TaxID=752182 RepID=UPI0035A2AD44